jgi:hypothetical protein
LQQERDDDECGGQHAHDVEDRQERALPEQHEGEPPRCSCPELKPWALRLSRLLKRSSPAPRRRRRSERRGVAGYHFSPLSSRSRPASTPGGKPVTW